MPKPVRKLIDKRPPMISPSLTLPDGHQSYFGKWFADHGEPNTYGVTLQPTLKQLKAVFARAQYKTERLAYMYTQHEIFLQPPGGWEIDRHGCGRAVGGGDIAKQTRSSPNWEGGLATYATCKHQMRTWRSKEEWLGVWICGLNPASMSNTLLFVGQVRRAFASNFHLHGWLQSRHPKVVNCKRADWNPRGDLYMGKRILHQISAVGKGKSRVSVYDHNNFHPPRSPHTRSVEHYKTSPGSVNPLQCLECGLEGEDVTVRTTTGRDRFGGQRTSMQLCDSCGEELTAGPVPKWWRDIEYELHGRRPPVFILDPCLIWPHPLLTSGCSPGRACLKLSVKEFLASLETA